MRQIYFCPNCRAPIGYGDRFCGNCGTNLKWEIQQVPPESSYRGYDCPNPGQQQMTNSQQLLYSEAAISGNANQNRQRYMYRNDVATSTGQRSSSGGVATPLSAEVSKILEDFFDKRAKRTR